MHKIDESVGRSVGGGGGVLVGLAGTQDGRLIYCPDPILVRYGERYETILIFPNVQLQTASNEYYREEARMCDGKQAMLRLKRKQNKKKSRRKNDGQIEPYHNFHIY